MTDGHPVEDVLAQLKASIDKLRQENSELKTAKEELTTEVNELNAAAEEAEECRDNAVDDRDEAFAAIREEKRRWLVLMRRLEFSLHGLCPLCLGVVEHKTACDLKLAIWRVDHELNRTEYVHL